MKGNIEYLREGDIWRVTVHLADATVDEALSLISFLRAFEPQEGEVDLREDTLVWSNAEWMRLMQDMGLNA